MNLPNQITVGRFFLAVILLALLAGFDLRRHPTDSLILEAAFWIFIVAAVTDILDGYLARKQNQVTSFGRVLDPFVDKILVCGSFILLLGRGFVDDAGQNVTGLSAWMVVVIVARELLVSGLRGFNEAAGTPFASNIWGKIKMVVQSVTVPTILRAVMLADDAGWIDTLRVIMIWSTVGVTAASVFPYLFASRAVLSEQSRG